MLTPPGTRGHGFPEGISYTETVPEPAPAILRFGAFELDVRAGELRRGGVLIKVAPQPLEILRVLAEGGGEMVTREESRQGVWGPATFVDLDRNLNVAIAQIRAALGDDADSPRFVATIPKKGYRFVAPVERVESAGAAAVRVIPAAKPRRAPWGVIRAAAESPTPLLPRSPLPCRPPRPRNPPISA